MIHLFHLRNYNSRIYFLLLMFVILMEVGVANERRGQETYGSSKCDSTGIHVNFTCTTEAISILNAPSTMQNDNIAENRNFTEQFETNGQNNTNNEFALSTLNENKICDFKDIEQSGKIIVKCNDLSRNMSNSSVEVFSSENVLYEIMVSVGLFLVWEGGF